jgi:hypothetical protein
LASLLLALTISAPASASAPSWNLQAPSIPTVFNQADNSLGVDMYQITVTNRGGAPTDGSPVTITDDLPVGFTLDPAGIYGGGGVIGSWNESNTHGGELVCQESLPVTCTFTGTLGPGGYFTMYVAVTVPEDAASSVTNRVSVTGGGAANVSLSEVTDVGVAPTSFGLQDFEAWATDENGLPAIQAGSHPYEAGIDFTLKTEPHHLVTRAREEYLWSTVSSDVKETRTDLPAGLIGDPNAVPQCAQQQFYSKGQQNIVNGDGCPDDTAVGTVQLKFNGKSGADLPVFNLVPPPGVAASFGFDVISDPIVLNASVKTGGDYGVQIVVSDISEAEGITGAYFTFWGVPADPSHNMVRGNCLTDPLAKFPVGGCPSGLALPFKPFLTMPTACLGPLTTAFSADSWAKPEEWSTLNSISHDNNGHPVGIGGCDRVDFNPEISVAPDGTAGSTPTGLGVDIHVPQERILIPTSLTEATVRNTTVTLPAGVALNPAAADGLQTCSTGQTGYEGIEQGTGSLLFSNMEMACPDASKIATVEIETPLLEHKLTGAAYLAAQDENPFGSLFAIYLEVKDPYSGVLVKLAGQVTPDPVTGQIVSTFENTPQLPFSNLRLHFFGTARAPLTTPTGCGDYQTTASITPWSSSEPATPSSTFQITSGPNGTPCESPLPFDPSLTGGVTSIQAGSFSPFTMTMSREDGTQNLGGIQLKMPPGLLGTLSSVKLCGEPQADAGTCGAESEIGETIVSVGAGGDPFSVKGGKVFITGPYEGAPYGLSIVNPAKAGPFDLEKGTPCDCVVVRARIEVNPITAALTITTDNTGPYKIPTILDGIPLQIRHVNVTIDRPNFTFNPTNCDPMDITGSLTSTEGASSALKVPFQVTNCATLAFKPKLTVSTTGKTSRANGASLHVKLTYPEGPYDANIKAVKVDLPRQLPSRLTTLQKACTAATFEANPAACPSASIVGHASAVTPVLPVSLEGPAYFVSYGGAKFPELVIVLQGYGTTVDLHGETFISKAGITSSTFKTVPDVPVGTFELTLPQGKYSALAANGNLCTSKLAMPTAFAGQNGAEIHTSTPVTATGCAKHAVKKKSKKKTAHHAKKSR